MQKNHTCKILAIGIICLFIGVSILPAFAIDVKTSAESLIKDSENEKYSNLDDEIYENTNCFVMGRTSATYRIRHIGWNFYFGYNATHNIDWKPSNGWIYTNGNLGKWKYEGEFYGCTSHSFYFLFPDGVKYTHYNGIEGFRGLAFGAKIFFRAPYAGGCIFIGYAKHVRISPNHP